ncbi:hypothetical protein FACS189443_2040 [Planctomycetales bacterium]|nr:hypothetical protein FACS189443_2040 [Planctomycetales bacterium]
MRAVLILVVFVCLLTGCGGLYPAKIALTLDGKPLENAAVELVPKNKNPKCQPEKSKTDAEGLATFQTGGKDGVYSGEYTITVSKRITLKNFSDAEIKAMQSTGIILRNRVVSVVDEKYTDPEKSGLTVKFGYWSQNEFLFDLQKPKEPE